MKARESNIELLRIALMIIIIVWHCIVYGESFLQNLSHSSYVYIAPLLTFPVNCFVFISGFYGLRLKRNKLLSFWGMLITYSVSIYLFTSIYIESFDLKNFIISLFPISTNYWWFFTLYVFLLIISPMLNICDSWDKVFFKKMLILLGVFYLGIISLLFGTKMGCIGDLPLFIFLYLLGRYLKKYPVKILTRHCVVNLIVLYLVDFLFIYVGRSDEQWMLKLISYNNPIIVLIAIEVFYLFKEMNIGTIKAINTISSTVFASYIVTESSLRHAYISLVTNLGYGMVWYGMVAILTIMIICPFELVRKKASTKIFEWITRKSYKII